MCNVIGCVVSRNRRIRIGLLETHITAICDTCVSWYAFRLMSRPTDAYGIREKVERTFLFYIGYRPTDTKIAGNL